MADQYVHRVRSASSGWPGGPGLNTHYFHRNDAVPGDDLTDATSCAARVRAFWVALAPMFPSNWVVAIDPVVDVLNCDQGDLVESNITPVLAPVPGTSTYGFGPEVTMFCANLLTPDIIDGRRVKGRGFYGPTTIIDDTNGTPTAAMVSQLQVAATDLLGGTIGVPAQVVWSRRRPPSLGHPTGLGGSSHVISGVTVRDSYAILRSRRA